MADIGGPPNEFFIIEPRTKWVDMFVKWLSLPHNQDKMCIIGEDEDEEEEEEEESSDSSEDEGASPGTNSSDDSGEMESSSGEEEEG